MMDPPTSSRVTCCGHCIHCISTFGLIIMNLVDLCTGILLLLLGGWVKRKIGDGGNTTIAWLVWTCITLGALLFLTSVLSFASVCFKKSCRCLGAVSEQLSTLVAVLSVALGITFAILRGDMLSYVRDNQEDLELSDQEIDTFRDWYTVTNVVLCALGLLELGRFYVSRKYRLQSYRIQKEGEYDALMETEKKESDYNSKREKRKSEIREKYKNLREYYSSKHKSASNVEGDTASSSNPFDADDDGEESDMVV